MKIALVQTNPTVGDLVANADRILEGCRQAQAQGAAVAVFPELSLPGYPPNDLLERGPFLAECAAEAARIVETMPEGITVIFGTVRRVVEGDGADLYNTAVVARRGEVLREARKILLPVYDVFDEARYFRPGGDPADNLVTIDGAQVGITICEDMWNDKEFWKARRYTTDPVEALATAGAEIIVNLSSSPWSGDKSEVRRRMVEHTARRHDVFVAYTNQVGGNDGLLFDGGSMAVAPDGTLMGHAKTWQEDLLVVDISATQVAEEPPQREIIADIHDALVMGVADYFRKLRFDKAVVALSGGIDSAVTAMLAVQALGADAVTGLALPSRYSSQGSVDDALSLAANLGIECHVVEIEAMFAAYLEQLAPVFGDRPPGLAEENLQARIRGAVVMAYSNKFGAVVLTTGNKSESAVGYCTLYGDTCGGLAPLADLYKNQVYALARYANRDREVIPANTIDKPPSAELRPDQKDEDSLPPYDVLDELLRLLIEERQSIDDIAAALAQPRALVQDIVNKVYAAEFKRKQFPPTLRVSAKAWIGRVYPLAHRFRR